MAQTAVTIHTTICDVCGRTVKDDAGRTLSLDGQTWDLDLCKTDAAKFVRDITKWAQKGRQRSVRGPRRNTQDEWEYLESQGFTRHRGRKSAEEQAALDRRR